MSSTDYLRKFGCVMACAFLLFGGIFYLLGRGVWPFLLVLSVIFGLMGAFAPQALGPVEKVWMKFAHLMGRVMTPVILSLVFYLILTPIALVLRITGKDLLELNQKEVKSSYWKIKKERQMQMEDYERQF